MHPLDEVPFVTAVGLTKLEWCPY